MEKLFQDNKLPHIHKSKGFNRITEFDKQSLLSGWQDDVFNGLS